MKKSILALLAVLILTSCSSYVKIGQLNIISNRNFETKQTYQLVSKNVEGKSKVSKYGNAISEAIDAAVMQYKNGEYMMNVTIYMTQDGKNVKVIGDVWGTYNPDAINIKDKFNVGDAVLFKWKDSIVEGKILGKNDTEAIVEFKFRNLTRKELIRYEQFTKK